MPRKNDPPTMNCLSVKNNNGKCNSCQGQQFPCLCLIAMIKGVDQAKNRLLNIKFHNNGHNGPLMDHLYRYVHSIRTCRDNDYYTMAIDDTGVKCLSYYNILDILHTCHCSNANECPIDRDEELQKLLSEKFYSIKIENEERLKYTENQPTVSILSYFLKVSGSMIKNIYEREQRRRLRCF